MRNSIRPTSHGNRLLRAGTTIVAALALVGFSLSPAVAAGGPATPASPTTEQYEYVNWDCGYPMQVRGESTNNRRVRPNPAGGDDLFIENFAFAETWTNSAGDSFGLSARGLAKEWKAKSLGGSLYEISGQISGQPQVVTVDGAVIARDRGLVSYRFTRDVTGAGEFLGVKVNGPHPGFDTDLCLIVAPFVGNTSAEHQTPRPLGTTDAGMGYYEYLPPSYDETGAGSPLLIHANGYGENGDGSAEGLGSLLFSSIPRFINVGGWPLDRPFVVLSTQHIEQPGGLGPSCDGVQWPGTCIMQLQHDAGHPPQSPCTTPGELHDFISYAIANYHVDPAHIYVTGLSCGAFGVWEYLAAYGDQQVAAAVPIAGNGGPAWATSGCGLRAVPIWAFAGELDDVVNPLGSIDTINSLSACPGVTPDRAQLTTYPDLFHEGWDQAYSGSRGQDIYTWMLSYSH